MNFKNSLKENISKENLLNVTGAIGYVVKFYNKTNRADIFISSTTKKDGRLIRDVPIAISGNGMHQSALKEKDEVYVQFTNGSIFNAKVISKSDEIYEKRTKLKERHRRKGTYIINTKLESDRNIEDSYIPSSFNWIKYDNEDLLSFYEYKDVSISDYISNVTSELGSFRGQEIGIYNPINSSVVKILDNGDIHIFGDNNVGIKINVLERSINFFGDLYINGDSLNIDINNLNINCKSINKNINGEI